MNEIVPSEDQQGLRLARSKIEEYNLGETVLDLYLTGMKPYRIVKKCNVILSERKDDIKYAEITLNNVLNFLKSQKGEIDNAHEAQLSLVHKSSININQKLNSIITVLEEQLDKLSDIPDMTDTKHEQFMRCVREIRQTLEVAASVEAKIQPSISVQIFTTNIEKFCNKIAQAPELTDDAKQAVLNYVSEILANENVLKPIDGKTL